MRISEVEIFHIKLKPIVSNWNPVIIRVTASDGVSGIGEAGLAYGTGSAAAVGMLRSLAEEHLLGKNPMRIEHIWENMIRHSFWGLGGGPVVYSGISAINQALWDIKGKVLNVPIYELLGGLFSERVRAYASQIQFGWSDKGNPCVKPEDYAKEAEKAVSAGFSAIKVDPFGYDFDGSWGISNLRIPFNSKMGSLFYERVKAVRETVGSDVDIIIEAHGCFGTRSAIQAGRLIEEFNPLYFEEPIHSMNVDCLQKVSNNLNTAIAAGERIYTRYGYRQYLERQVLDVIQPDIGLAGGISETRKIADYAAMYDVCVQCHVCGSPVATAVSIQLEASLPNFIIHEQHVSCLKEENLNIVKNPLKPMDGFFNVPDSPGFGIELDERTVRKHEWVTIS